MNEERKATIDHCSHPPIVGPDDKGVIFCVTAKWNDFRRRMTMIPHPIIGVDEGEENLTIHCPVQECMFNSDRIKWG